MVRDIVAIFDECVNLLWCPRLSIFENFTEFIKLCWDKLRRTAAEAWTEFLNIIFIPRVSSPMRRGPGDPDAVARLLSYVSLAEILYET